MLNPDTEVGSSESSGSGIGGLLLLGAVILVGAALFSGSKKKEEPLKKEENKPKDRISDDVASDNVECAMRSDVSRCFNPSCNNARDVDCPHCGNPICREHIRACCCTDSDYRHNWGCGCHMNGGSYCGSCD